MTKKTWISKDWSVEKPGLHMFYVKQAVTHLLEIDAARKRFNDLSNLNLSGVQEALHVERKKLVEENKAYADADEIVRSIPKPGRRVLGVPDPVPNDKDCSEPA